MIRTVIFDIDNTLYSFTDANTRALAAIREYTREQFLWSAEEFEARHASAQNEIYEMLHFNGSCRDRALRYQRILEKAGLPLYPHLARMYHLYWETLLDAMTPYDGALDVMQTLKQKGITIGACTDMTLLMQIKKLEKLEILSYVSFVVTSEEAGVEKPNREIFRLAAEKAGCDAGECLFVGDVLEKDCIGSRSFGMHALWLHGKDESCPEGIVRIQGLREIPDYLSVF